MNYEVLTPLKVRTSEGIRELRAGEVIALPEEMALKLIESGKVKTLEHSRDCFDPEGILEEIFREGQTHDEVLETIDALIQAGCLQAPWGIKVKESPLLGDWWILSDITAKERIPSETISFTLEELKPIVESARVFGGEVIEVRENREASNGKDALENKSHVLCRV